LLIDSHVIHHHYTYEPDVQNSDTWPFDDDQYLLLNVAINGDITPSFTSGEMVVDYVRVYQQGTMGHMYNPTSQVFANGVLLSWDPPENAAGCEVRGGKSGGNDAGRVVVLNSNPNFVFVNGGALGSGGDFQWKVRCATGVNPVQGLSDFSPYDNFSYPLIFGAPPAPVEYTEQSILKW
jgi:hypothetical protein